MSGDQHTQVFISCVTAEFGSYRDTLRRGLKQRSLDVHIQEDFVPFGTPTLEELNSYIVGSDWVIHIVGDMTGAMANPHSVDAIKRACPDIAKRLSYLKSPIETGNPPLSYTQWEAYLALYHRKRLLIVVPFDTTPRDKGFKNEVAQVAAQQAHLERLKTLNRHPAIQFATSESLLNGVLRALMSQLGSDLLAVPPESEPEIRSKPINLPYPSLGTLFKGRDEFMADLRKSLARADGKRAAAIYNAVHGLGGVGKTRLAVEYAWQYEVDYTALLFAVAEARVEPTSIAPDGAAPVPSPSLDLRRNLAALADPLILNLPEHEVPEEQKRVVAVIRWLQQNPGWLLIVDNADSVESAKEVEKLLSQLRGGHVLITSRRRNWSGAVQRKELGLLEPEAAEAFLLEATENSRQDLPDDSAQAKVLAHDLGYLALALEQAAAYIDRHHLNFAEYLRAWRENHDAVAAWFDPQTISYPMSFAVTWHTSVARLKSQTRQVLNRLAFLSPEPIPETLLDVNLPADGKADHRAAVAELSAYSLVTWIKGAPAFSVHRLVQDATSRSLTGRGYDEALREALSWLTRGFDLSPFDARNWPKLDAVAPHVRSVAEHGEKAKILVPTAWLLGKLGDLLQSRLPFGEVQPLYQRALILDRERVEVNSDDTGAQRSLFISYLRIGDIQFAQNEFERALQAYEAQRVISERLAKLQPKDETFQRDLALTYERVGTVHLRQDNLQEALRSFRDALAITSRLANDHPDDSVVQIDLNVLHERVAVIHQKNDQLSEALTGYKASLAILERLVATDPHNAEWQHRLSFPHFKIAEVQLAQGNRAAACEGYKVALAIRKRIVQDYPANVRWQLDLVDAHIRLADLGDDAAHRWLFVVETLRKLKAENKLTSEQANKWLPEAEQHLAKI